MARRPRSAVYISDVLIVKACNTPGGSGGVADELNNWMKRCLLRAKSTAPVNKKGDAVHRGGVTGTYAKSFKKYRRGNGHYLLRSIYNDAPHAVFVEKGRRNTQFGSVVFGNDWGKTPTHWLGRVGGGDRQYDPDIRYTYWRNGPAGQRTVGYKWERFSWTRNGGNVWWYAGTSGREGKHTLEKAWKWSTRKYQVAVISGRNVKPGGRIPAWAGPGSRPTT